MRGKASALIETQPPRYLVIHHTDIENAEQAQMVDASHARRGYAPSSIINPVTGTGWHIAYHYLIGKDGTVLKTREDDERTQHTSCGLGLTKCLGTPEVNDHSIAIVLAGNYEHEKPTKEQLASLRSLVATLDKQYRFEKIMTHRDASPTSCPGDNLVNAIKDVLRLPAPAAPAASADVWNISRYYTPVQGQQRYYRQVSDEKLFDAILTNGMVEKRDGQYWYAFAGPSEPIGTTTEDIYDWFASHPDTKEAIRKELEYLADFKVNCSGDCFVTADGTNIKDKRPFTVAACPPTMKFGTRLRIEGFGEVVCHDRGGAIQGKRLDVWSGYGDDGLQNIRNGTGGPRKVRVL